MIANTSTPYRPPRARRRAVSRRGAPVVPPRQTLAPRSRQAPPGGRTGPVGPSAHWPTPDASREDRQLRAAVPPDTGVGAARGANEVDGQDVGAVYLAVVSARARARRGEGPSFIEAVTYRYHGHQTNEMANYRTEDEVEFWRRTRDPIERLRRALERAGELGSGQGDKLAATAKEIVEEAIRFADESPFPDPATAADGVMALAFDPKGPMAK